ncbi:MAG: hypothetical protein KF770_04220 [Anaerolineae bacterium]|nr:hypothetical protein [Anaerolineae bacterium]
MRRVELLQLAGAVVKPDSGITQLTGNDIYSPITIYISQSDGVSGWVVQPLSAIV